LIPVVPVPEPTGFEARARRPGKAWLRSRPDAKRPRDLWSPFLEDLSRGFSGLCGYAAMLDPTGGTVDHYLSYRRRPELAYEWSNYRFASGPLNASKKTADEAVLDPYEVGRGWFEIILPSLQMKATSRVPRRLRSRAEYTLKRLKLRDGEKLIRWRRRWYAMYQEGKLSLEGLRQVAPLIADAVEREAGKQVGRRAPKSRQRASSRASTGGPRRR
jgi:hypothetical protein